MYSGNCACYFAAPGDNRAGDTAKTGTPKEHIAASGDHKDDVIDADFREVGGDDAKKKRS